ncbi:MAG: hypothetical protein Q3998_01735 [Porphyromonas sp.]|nr:hypothetical protein [Porphyromonas sp.]
METINLSPASVSAFGQNIHLPLSKSIYNRLLIIEALGGYQDKISPLASKAIEDNGQCYPNDILVLGTAMAKLATPTSPEETLHIDVEDCGSALRFIAAYAVLTTKNNIVISGTERLMERPMGELLDALTLLGGCITKEKKENGEERITIRPASLKSKKIDLTRSRSSQFISALLLISPYLPEGIEITWDATSVSNSYVYMTLSLMKRYGAECEYTDRYIKVSPGRYNPVSTRDMEADWSSALYWFAYIALSPIGSTLELQELTFPSLQGDAMAAALFRLIGVKTERDEETNSILITRVPCVDNFHSAFDGLNMHVMPDAAPTLAVVLALRGITYRMVGLETLPLKESNRLLAVKEGLRLFGLDIELTSSSISFQGKAPAVSEDEIFIDSHKDHRIIMSFAAATAMGFKLRIDNPSTVNKSYPSYWKELEQILGTGMVRE